MKWSIFDKGNEHLLDSLDMDPDSIKLLKEGWMASNAEIFEMLKDEKYKLPTGSVITYGDFKERTIINSDLLRQKLRKIEPTLVPNQYAAVAITDKLYEGDGWVKVAVSFKEKGSSRKRLAFRQVITDLVVEHKQLLIVEKTKKGSATRPWDAKNKIPGGHKMVFNNDDRAIEVISITLSEDGVVL
ncbi:hypothetical protein [Aeromonas hydrophila]|uniref:hypothetical protein n=1 Tax=Aeromonas hydrophila TaxID=644 RepID=UPI001C5AC8CD|nr:hypothetical protein [Aeromonas hydrophila]EHK5440722.1 hypothetical protein [Aeromonas hydrophila]MBW3846602.1 hypothetical protein [Aeromonas hydrophila]